MKDIKIIFTTGHNDDSTLRPKSSIVTPKLAVCVESILNI